MHARTTSSVRTGAARLAILCLLLAPVAAWAVDYLASNVFGVRWTPQSVKPSNCTGTVPCSWSDLDKSWHYDGSWTLNRTPVANTAKTVGDGEYLIAYTSLSATRTVTLPFAASAFGRVVVIVDESGSASSTVKLRALSAGFNPDTSLTDTVNGSTSAVDVVTVAYGASTCTSDGLSKWSCGVTSVGGGTTQTIDVINATAATGKQLTAAVADSGANVAFIFNNSTALSGSTVLASFRNNGSERFSIDNAGGLAAVGGLNIGGDLVVGGDGNMTNLNVVTLNGTGASIDMTSTFAVVSTVANSGTNSASTLNSGVALSGTTRLATWSNNSVEKASIYNDGTMIGARFQSNSSAPACSLGTANGSTGSPSCTLSAGSNNSWGEVTIHTGNSSGSAGAWWTLTLANSAACAHSATFGGRPVPRNDAARTLMNNFATNIGVKEVGTASTVEFNVDSSVPATNTDYVFGYSIGCF